MVGDWASAGCKLRRIEERRKVWGGSCVPSTTYRNNEELYEKAKPDAVIISTADFQHPLHLIEAVAAGCQVCRSRGGNGKQTPVLRHGDGGLAR